MLWQLRFERRLRSGCTRVISAASATCSLAPVPPGSEGTLAGLGAGQKERLALLASQRPDSAVRWWWLTTRVR